MWNQRYSDDDYAYGTEPNDFLVSMSKQLSKGKMLCIGEGEGRNAVWLAQQGYEVTAVDSSEIGLHKAEKLAKSRGVNIKTVHADLSDIQVGNQHGIVLFQFFVIYLLNYDKKYMLVVFKDCVRTGRYYLRPIHHCSLNLILEGHKLLIF